MNAKAYDFELEPSGACDDTFGSSKMPTHTDGARFWVLLGGWSAGHLAQRTTPQGTVWAFTTTLDSGTLMQHKRDSAAEAVAAGLESLAYNWNSRTVNTLGEVTQFDKARLLATADTLRKG